jgi:hypothetical protein
MRPEWLPEEYDYRRRKPPQCDYCAAPVENDAVIITWKLFKQVQWCDSPTCEAKARAYITGEGET